MAFETVNLAQIYGAVDRDKANRMQMQNMQLQQERYQRQNQIEDAEYADKLRFKDIYRNNISPDGKLNEEGLISGLYQGGFPEKALEYQEKTGKMKSESRKSDLEYKKGLASYFRDRLSTVTDDASYQQVMQEAQELGAGFVANAPAQFDPKWLAANVRDAEKFLEQSTPKWEKVDRGGKIQFVDTNPFTNPAIKGTELDKTPTISDMETARHNRAAEASAYQANTLKAEENSIKRNEKIPSNSTDIRKEFDQLPEVKNYKQALPSYKGIEDAVTRNTPAADINIVYGIAKLYDPTSVVREGEYATVANSPNIPEKIKGYAQYLAGGGRLTPQVKQDLLAEAQSRIKSYEDQYLAARSGYTDIANRSNADPSLVFPGEFKPAISKPASSKPSGPLAQVKTDSDYAKLPKGTRFKAPDGTIRIKQ